MAYSPSTICSGCCNLCSETAKIAYPAYGLNESANPTQVLPSVNDLSPGSMLSNSFHGEVNPWDTVTNATKTNSFENRSDASGFQDSTPSFHKEANVKRAANELSPRSMLSNPFYGKSNPWDTVPNTTEVGNGFQNRSHDSGFQVHTPPAKKATIKNTTSPNPCATRTKKQTKSSPTSSPGPFICKWAKCKTPGPFSCKNSLMRHVESQHVAPRSVRCSHEACPRVFSRRDNMVMHVRAVHGAAS